MVRVELPFVPPYDWAAMIDFLGARAIQDVEVVDPDRYRRTFALGEARGVLDVSLLRGENALVAIVETHDDGEIAAVVDRLRQMFDLDADIKAIDARLAADPFLAALVRERPGVRAPGTWDAFELAVRALIGQQVSVRAARTFAGRIAAAYGSPLAAVQKNGGPGLVFPAAAAIAGADLTGIGLTGARAAALSALAGAVAGDESVLAPRETLDEAILALTALPGVGAWTAHYIAMRALREPDAFPAADLGLLKAVARDGVRPTPAALLAMAEAWRPWRAYAAFRLWIQVAGGRPVQNDSRSAA